MRRLWRILTTLLLVAALIPTSAAAAIADHGDTGTDDWSGADYEDDWYDDQYLDDFDDDWYDNQYLDDYDDEFDFEDNLEDDWYDDQYLEIEAAAVTTMLDAIDACFGGSDLGFATCILDAIDGLYGEALPYDDEFDFNDGFEFDDNYDDEFDFNDGFYDDPEPVSDPQAEAEILARFNELIPAEWRDRIVSFELETDGRDGVVAAVEPANDDLTEWVLFVDPADADYDLDATLIHEFAHVVTLNETQIDAQLVSSDRQYEQAAAACGTYFTGEGCALSESYIAQFVDLFWDSIMDEFESINEIEGDRDWEEAMFDFYDEHSDEFVTDYAASDPAEDMSETFSAFVLSPSLPDGDTVAEQKILFFSQFEELMDLRDSIRQAL